MSQSGKKPGAGAIGLLESPADYLVGPDGVPMATFTELTPSSSQGGAEPVELDEPGTRIGRYTVLDILGQGGMGAVYVAYDPELDRRVALKLLRTRVADQAGRRLVREARALARLSHPNVVQVHDAGIHQGDVFLAMELVDGESLRDWCLRDPHPSWRSVLEAYIEAARGLAAAHEKGLIHRDIKPANVLMGADGRVRVADFGLASAADSSADESCEPERALPSADEAMLDSVESLNSLSSRDSSLGSTPMHDLTRTGAVLGTPAYMAPEQHLGRQVGPAADQYSLCVSLYEGLYGVRPFAAVGFRNPLAELLRCKLDREVKPPVIDLQVPSWVHSAVLRGLAPEPGERHASMSELIAALGSDPAAVRRTRIRRLVLVCAAVLLLAVAALGWFGRAVESRAAQCQGLERLLVGVWDPSVERQMQAAFSATGLTYANATYERVSSTFNGYADAWSAMRQDVCEATMVREEQTHGVMDLRVSCLERRRARLRASTEIFTGDIDAALLTRAVAMAHELPTIGYCADVDALTAEIPPPEDPDLRARVAVVEPAVARLETLWAAGRHAVGLQRGEPLLRELESLDYPPVRARAMYWVALLRAQDGRPKEAETLLRDALAVAARAKDDILVARAWSQLLHLVVAIQGRHEKADELQAVVEVALERADDDDVRAQALAILSVVHRILGRYPEARTAAERSLALRRRLLGPDHPGVADSLNQLANVLYFIGAYRDALDAHRQTLRIRERTLGASHPDIARSLHNLAFMQQTLGAYPAAMDLSQRAYDMWRETLGPEHFHLGYALNSMGDIHFKRGRYAEARAKYDQAMALWQTALSPEHHLVAIVQKSIAGIEHEQGDYQAARQRFEQARAIQEASLGSEHPMLAMTLVGLGRSLARLGQLEAGERAVRAALAIQQKVLAPEHPYVANTLIALGELALLREQPANAVAHLRRAVAIESDQRARARFGLARALWAVGDERTEARDLAERALRYHEGIEHEPGAARIRAWLAARPSE